MYLNFLCDDQPLDPEDITAVLYPKQPDSRRRLRRNQSVIQETLPRHDPDDKEVHIHNEAFLKAFAER